MAMNRPGQPPQRPPALGQVPGMAGQYRAPYGGFGLQQRSVNNLTSAYVPGLQRTSSQAQSLMPSSPFVQQPRVQGSYPFGVGTPQGQTLGAQPHQTNGNSASNDNGLDLNDFPALGATTGGGGGGAGSGAGGASTASYATQAGGVGQTAGTPGTTQTRDFTPDDFPALGGTTHNPQESQQQNQSQGQDHPPGLNGYQQEPVGPRQSLNSLGNSAQQGGSIPQGTPGMLNLTPAQARNVHPGFAEAEKQQQRNTFNMKLNPPSHAWASSPNLNPGSQPSSTPSQTGLGAGSFAPGSQQNGTTVPTSGSAGQLGAPPGVPPPQGFAGNHLQQRTTTPAPYTPNGLDASAVGGNAASSLPGSTGTHPAHHPQTPAQQVLLSSADRWGLLGLLALIRNATSDEGLLSGMGTDLGTMGLDMGTSGPLYSTFITPWADQSAAHSVEPEFHLPSCYAVNAPPPGPQKAQAFSEETLFYMFYAHPKDALQEVAAQELYSRNWRYHKELRVWITKESSTTIVQKSAHGEQGTYTIWDPESWSKEAKELSVMYADLEEKAIPAFAPTTTLVPTSAVQAQPAVQQPISTRASYQMGM
ncbi:uncharacterized protein SCHCODRAFT_02614346 [Schizophyllum commune H4-8]|uniref:NOT2/NOT3/NOT5 C-terminal domain-containing protein n=1 Tax=Schizophyllum commune (strain H4-8 / FGSC 9210) TaxID=578458 RepID=D8PZ67_SCHCM|nr:uncharacterized protein SCHCODRAFT_02614346 [Schizophyllum commune H4-8]KAI5896245.1 hypothetical protein SCHCODRAFT_02614346 [Schizophyllum commune H4-8]